MKKNLSELYKEWRHASEEMLEDGYTGSLDCGELKVREDFSRFAELSEVISFEEMLELEKSFENEQVKLPDNYKLLCETENAVFAHNRLDKTYATWSKDTNGSLYSVNYFFYDQSLPFTETTEKEAYKKALQAFADKI